MKELMSYPLTNFTETFNKLGDPPSFGQPSWVKEVRRTGLEKAIALGAPTRRQEEWKYTNTKPIAETAFTVKTEPGQVTRDQLEDVLNEGDCALVFVDGWYSPELSCIPTGHGLTVTDLASALKDRETAVRELLAKASRHNDAFHYLNDAFLLDGAFIEVKAGTAVDQPIKLVYVGTESAKPVAVFPRNLIHVGSSSAVNVIEAYVGLGGSKSFTNCETQIVIDANARLGWYRLQTEGPAAIHIGRAEVYLDRDARFETFNAAIGGHLVRNDLHIDLDGEGAEATLDGIYVVRDEQHVDNHTAVDHLKPNARSSQYYKGILGGRARAVFNGKVFVRQQAQQTNAYQLNKNLLLSSGAEIDTKPELQIDADDVRCSHGATVGQLNDEEVFYLRSRGIPEDRARAMLSHAFAMEVILKMSCREARDLVTTQLNRFFPEA